MVNISFLTEKLPYSQICGTKVGTAYKKRRQRFVDRLLLTLADEQSALLLLVSARMATQKSQDQPELVKFNNLGTGMNFRKQIEIVSNIFRKTKMANKVS